jgi:hypothetical protein
VASRLTPFFASDWGEGLLLRRAIEILAFGFGHNEDDTALIAQHACGLLGGRNADAFGQARIGGATPELSQVERDEGGQNAEDGENEDAV